MKSKQSSQTEKTALVPEINIQQVKITLIGDSSLISHKWSEKARKQMLDKQMKVAKSAKVARDPERDFLDSLYVLDGQSLENRSDVKKARFGFPTIAFKSAAVCASLQTDGGKKTTSRAAFHINGDLVEIKGCLPEPREDMVKVGMGTADLRYRGEFKNWHADVVVRYNADVMSKEQICNLFTLAGFGIGVGEWRPQKNGSYGMFHVANEAEVKALGV